MKTVRDVIGKFLMAHNCELWGETDEDARQFEASSVDELLSALKEAGLAVVPVEPTEKMLDATDDMDIYWGYRADGRQGDPKDVWSRMVAASQDQGRG